MRHAGYAHPKICIAAQLLHTGPEVYLRPAEKVELRTRANTKKSRRQELDERRVNIARTKGRLPVRKRLPLPIGQIGICAQIRVPLPDVLSTSSVPPRRNARSRIERKPR